MFRATFRARFAIILGVGLAGGLATQACGSKSGNSFGQDDGGFPPVEGGADATTKDSGSSGGEGGVDEASCIVCGDGGGSSSGGTASPIPATCADSVSRNSYIGCDYWPTVTLNPVWPQFDYAVAVSNPQTSDVTVTVTGGALSATKTVTVPAGQVQAITLPWVPELKGPTFDENTAVTDPGQSRIVSGGAYHLTTDFPVSVYQFSALEYEIDAGTLDPDGGTCPGEGDAGAGPHCYSYSNDAVAAAAVERRRGRLRDPRVAVVRGDAGVHGGRRHGGQHERHRLPLGTRPGRARLGAAAHGPRRQLHVPAREGGGRARDVLRHGRHPHARVHAGPLRVDRPRRPRGRRLRRARVHLHPADEEGVRPPRVVDVPRPVAGHRLHRDDADDAARRARVGAHHGLLPQHEDRVRSAGQRHQRRRPRHGRRDGPARRVDAVRGPRQRAHLRRAVHARRVLDARRTTRASPRRTSATRASARRSPSRSTGRRTPSSRRAPTRRTGST